MEHRTDAKLREALYGLFRYTAVGRERALTLAQVRNRAIIGAFPERAVRRAIEELVVIDHLPIAGDSTAGYYLVVTAAERWSQVRQLVARLRALARRLRVFARCTDAAQGGQMTLDTTLPIAAQARLERSVDRLIGTIDDEFDDEFTADEAA